MTDARTGARPDADPRGATWDRLLVALRERICVHNVDTWIAPLHATWTSDGLRLEAPDRATLMRVARHFRTVIEEGLRGLGVAGGLRIEVAAPPPALPIRITRPSVGRTFATFVVGQSNDGAFRAAGELIAGRRSPLFLHGPSGVGKTHLLHAIAHELTAQGLLVACLPAAELVAALVGAYGTTGHAGFWRELGPV